MANVYYGADQALILARKIAVLGYGSQGHAHALNLKESGADVRVGLRTDSASRSSAEAAGLSVVSPEQACEEADLIMVLVPDQTQKALYDEVIADRLSDGGALFFAHGFNIHYGLIRPPANVDVVMVAPKARAIWYGGPMKKVAVPSALVAVHQDASGKAKELGLSYAQGIGSTRAGVLETTFREETETDLFGEQVVLCGGLTSLILAGYETLVEAGYQPESAYFECLHELKLIIDLIYEGGISRMRYSISDTAEYGDLTRGPRVVTEETKAEMKRILGEIQSGKFASEWVLENQAGRPHFEALRRQGAEHPIESVGAELREMMPWLGKKAGK